MTDRQETQIETIVVLPLALDLHWCDDEITSISPRFADAVEQSVSFSAHAKEIESALERYINGQRPQWPDLPLHMTDLTDFQRVTLDATKAIPQGATRTYGELAADIGSSGGAQAVGRVMATNPFPIIYPCHRVLGSNGKLVGFSAKDGLKMKQYLLRLEGALL
tara:strand:+ start:1369 stop:1860 length:492 start_codon:yes stop_codon:yes gene_type:complete